MTGVTETATSTVNALSRNPVLLALLVFIIGVLVVFAWVGNDTREHYDNLYQALLENQAKILNVCGPKS
jgi:hypothetical protein